MQESNSEDQPPTETAHSSLAGMLGRLQGLILQQNSKNKKSKTPSDAEPKNESSGPEGDVPLSSSPISEPFLSTSPVQVNLSLPRPDSPEQPWLPRPSLPSLPSQALSNASSESSSTLLQRAESPEMLDYTFDAPSTRPTALTRMPSVTVSQPVSAESRKKSRAFTQATQPSTPTGFARHRHSSSLSRHPVKETLNASLTAEEDASEDDDCEVAHGPHSHRKLNQYKLGPVLGRGSAGIVEYAVDAEGREFAVKELSKNQLRRRKRSEAMKRARRRPGQPRTLQTDDEEKTDTLALIRMEIAIMKKLSHPNLVRLYEVLNVQDGDSLFMVMELCKGGPLTLVTLDNGGVPSLSTDKGLRNSEQPDHHDFGSIDKIMDEDMARSYFRQIILGVEYLHANDIVHRDIKPENILLSADRSLCKIVDFGVSEAFVKHGDDVSTKTVGSPAFMSPELSKAHNGLGVHARAADIWAMGVTLYCITVGHLPFQSANFLELNELIQAQPAVIPENVSPELRDCLDRLLTKTPDDRITMDELREHPWVTQNGQQPMPSKSENIEVLPEATGAEVQDALAPGHLTWEDIMASVRAAKKIKRLAGVRKAARRAFSADYFSINSSTTGSDFSSSTSSRVSDLNSSTSSRLSDPSSTVLSLATAELGGSTPDLAKGPPHQPGHGRSASLSVDDNYLETVRFVETQTHTEVVKRDADLRDRRPSTGSHRSDGPEST